MGRSPGGVDGRVMPEDGQDAEGTQAVQVPEAGIGEIRGVALASFGQNRNLTDRSGGENIRITWSGYTLPYLT